MLKFERGADGVTPGADHKTYGISVSFEGEMVWGNMVEVHGSALLRELILARLESLPMAEKKRYLAQMKSQHIRMRVPWSPIYEQVTERVTLNGNADKQLEPVAAGFLPNLLEPLLRRCRALRGRYRLNPED